MLFSSNFGNQDNPDDAIYAPERTTLDDIMPSISKYLPKINPITTTKVSGVSNELGNDYFDLIEKQATQKLQDRYFNTPDSLNARLTNQMNKRGLIGSGIETGATNQLYKTFGDELVDLQSNIAQQKAKTAKDVAFKNKDIEMYNADSSVGAQIKNNEFQNFLSELGLRAGSNEAETATNFDTKMFGSRVDLNKGNQDFRTKLMDQLNHALGNEKIDKDTRQVFEDIFGSNITGYLGKQGDDYAELINAQSVKPPDGSKPDGSFQWYVKGKGWTDDGITFHNGRILGIPIKGE